MGTLLTTMRFAFGFSHLQSRPSPLASLRRCHLSCYRRVVSLQSTERNERNETSKVGSWNGFNQIVKFLRVDKAEDILKLDTLFSYPV